jgi:hypothetical protein
MDKFIAEGGVEVTDEMFDKWAQEAEAISQGKVDPSLKITPFTGRAWETKTEPMRTRTLKVPDSLWNVIKREAEKDNISTSQAARNALSAGIRSLQSA